MVPASALRLVPHLRLGWLAVLKRQNYLAQSRIPQAGSHLAFRHPGELTPPSQHGSRERRLRQVLIDRRTSRTSRSLTCYGQATISRTPWARDYRVARSEQDQYIARLRARRDLRHVPRDR